MKIDAFSQLANTFILAINQGWKKSFEHMASVGLSRVLSADDQNWLLFYALVFLLFGEDFHIGNLQPAERYVGHIDLELQRMILGGLTP